jgi:O-antigen/teichoic acid export membrane protein
MNLLTLNFWFNSRPAALIPFFYYLLVVAILIFIVAAFFLWIIKNRQKSSYNRLWSKIIAFSATHSFIGLLLLFFNYERIPFLSARFWFIVWGAGILAWAAYIYKYFKTIPEKRKIAQEKREFNKYIP